jgi:hypothetical protein
MVAGSDAAARVDAGAMKACTVLPMRFKGFWKKRKVGRHQSCNKTEQRDHDRAPDDCSSSLSARLPT